MFLNTVRSSVYSLDVRGFFCAQPGGRLFTLVFINTLWCIYELVVTVFIGAVPLPVLLFLVNPAVSTERGKDAPRGVPGGGVERWSGRAF